MSHLIAFEGLDQSGKQTQAEALRDYLAARGRSCMLLSFPDYQTPVGREISLALHGEREYAADVMQLLYITNRYEKRELIARTLAAGTFVVCDRYLASSIAYGEAQGLDPGWLADAQRYLPAPALTLLLDIEPATAVQRKSAGRDRYERDLDLLTRVRRSYLRQAAASGWHTVDGRRSRDAVAADVIRGFETGLAQR